MSQCVPSWDVDENNPPPPRLSLRSNSNSTATDVPMLDYEVAELTWENGQPSMHGLGLPRHPGKPSTASAATTTTASRYTWEKPRAGGTLESIVNQATNLPHHGKLLFDGVGGGGGGDGSNVYGNMLAPWLAPHGASAVATASNTVTMDALVPCSKLTEEHGTQVMDSNINPGIGGCMVGSSTHVRPRSGAAITTADQSAILAAATKRARMTRVSAVASRDQSVSGSATFGRDSQHLTLDTCDREFDLGFTSTSMGSPENTSSAKQCTKNTVDDHDSVCHSRPMRDDGDEEEKKKGIGKSSVCTKRSRAAAIHNQSERKRRDKINQRMKTLQKLVPNSSKSDKASMLDEVIEYLKQLQAQLQMMNRINMSSMMLPMAMQQQLQMSMMAGPMGMGMGMGMGMNIPGMDMNTMNRSNIPGMPPLLHPSAFMPMPSWDGGGGDRVQGPPPPVMPDPSMFPFFGCQAQPMNMDAYSRIAAMYQQMHQPPPSGSKN
ncbi:hypothetical protein TanjilG_24892 [Lupinus angustifolius]|uniref:BHLH domain-containing protein n=1 Tax=Lupinus angustifolius TaxID=3871 RepID=A0A4P1R023_LUPAN|nr:PREDICTED: transcription factor UNE10 isoform X1 [Lupinus angustifolius]OIV98721.1 hypothetical protein TanjilG_24892 [Lupinus angustifolius]